MALVALLAAERETANGGSLVAMLPISGRMLLERQARQACRAGASALVVRVGAIPAALSRWADSWRAAGVPVELVRRGTEIADTIHPEDRVLVFADGLVIDDRVLTAVANSPDPVLASVSRDADARFELIDSSGRWGGIALLAGHAVRSGVLDIGDWDLGSTLMRLAAASGVERLLLDSLPLYVSARRREVPLLVQMPFDAREAGLASEELLRSAQKGCLDWPARYIHPPIEDALVRLVQPTRITPNMITVATGVVGLAAVLAFASGWLWTGLVMMLVLGPLDGVDGKLARSRLEFSRWGDLEHVLDKIVEYGAFLALGGWLAHDKGHYGPWAIAAMVVGFALAEALQGELYNRFTGQQLDDRGPQERMVRLVAGRRNTFFWTLLPFAWFNAWQGGLIVLGIYSALTFFVAQAFFIRGLKGYAIAHLPLVAANFEASRYAFLASPKRSTR